MNGGEELGIVIKLTGTGGEQDPFASRRPSDYIALPGLKSQTDSLIAQVRHRIHIARSFCSTQKSQLLAIGSKAGRGNLSDSCCQALSAPPIAFDQPEVIFSYKDNGILVDGGEAHISLKRHFSLLEQIDEEANCENDRMFQ